MKKGSVMLIFIFIATVVLFSAIVMPRLTTFAEDKPAETEQAIEIPSPAPQMEQAAEVLSPVPQAEQATVEEYFINDISSTVESVPEIDIQPDPSYDETVAHLSIYLSSHTLEAYNASGDLLRSVLCTVGAPGTPTVTGVFSVYDKHGGFYTHNNTWFCRNMIGFYGNYGIHSLPHDVETWEIADDRLGYDLSAGCVRVSDDDIDWLFEHTPIGTTVEIIN